MFAVRTISGQALHRQPTQLSFPLLDIAEEPAAPAFPRREDRESAVKLVEYSPYPRVSVEQNQRTTYTLDVSDSGMRIATHSILPKGTLLHVVVRSVGGSMLQDALARVVWSQNTETGQSSAGLELVTETIRPLMKADSEITYLEKQVA
jgi:hypothetical protein